MILSMRVSVEIDESTLHDLRRLTGEEKMSPAIRHAVTEFVRRQRVREFGRLLREGTFDYPLTNDEIESQETGPGGNLVIGHHSLLTSLPVL